MKRLTKEKAELLAQQFRATFSFFVKQKRYEKNCSFIVFVLYAYQPICTNL